MVHIQPKMKAQVKRISEGVLEAERTSRAITIREISLDGWTFAKIARISARLRDKDHTW
jgi:hypothetical protein